MGSQRLCFVREFKSILRKKTEREHHDKYSMCSDQTGSEKKYRSHQKWKVVEQPSYCNSAGKTLAAFKVEFNAWELSGMKATQ